MITCSSFFSSEASLTFCLLGLLLYHISRSILRQWSTFSFSLLLSDPSQWSTFSRQFSTKSPMIWLRGLVLSPPTSPCIIFSRILLRPSSVATSSGPILTLWVTRQIQLPFWALLSRAILGKSVRIAMPSKLQKMNASSTLLNLIAERWRLLSRVLARSAIWIALSRFAQTFVAWSLPFLTFRMGILFHCFTPSASRRLRLSSIPNSSSGTTTSTARSGTEKNLAR